MQDSLENLEGTRPEGARGVPERSGGTPRNGSLEAEVGARARRRRFSPVYKLEMLKTADACKKPGEVGELLRREGLYSSHLVAWRKERDRGALGRLSRKRGRRPETSPVAAELEKARREIERLHGELRKAELIIEFQKKLSEILDIPLGKPPILESNESK